MCFQLVNHRDSHVFSFEGVNVLDVAVVVFDDWGVVVLEKMSSNWWLVVNYHLIVH